MEVLAYIIFGMGCFGVGSGLAHILLSIKELNFDKFSNGLILIILAVISLFLFAQYQQ